MSGAKIIEGLEPCPFCGVIPPLKSRPADKCENTNTGKVWSVTCYGDSTNAHAWFFADTAQAVVAAWNRRAPAKPHGSALPMAVEALAAAVETIEARRGSLSGHDLVALTRIQAALSSLQGIGSVARSAEPSLASREASTLDAPPSPSSVQGEQG